MAGEGRLTIARRQLHSIVAHSWREWPNEACGLLLGRDGRVLRVVTATNDRPSPTSFEVRPEDVYRAMCAAPGQGEDLVAIYHSHPGGEPVPSREDIGRAAYPGAAYVIVALGESGDRAGGRASARVRARVRAYRIAGGTAEPLVLRVVGQLGPLRPLGGASEMLEWSVAGRQAGPPRRHCPRRGGVLE